jgi:hypothetical protein
MSGLSWLVAVALPLQSAPPSETPDPLRELVAASEVIAWVRVEGLREFTSSDADGVATFLELRIETMVLGPGDPPVVHAGAGTEPMPQAEVGEHALAFLARGPNQAWMLRPGGLWRVTGDGGRLLRPDTAPRLPFGDGRFVPRATFSAALDLALDLELPRFEVHKITTGPQPYHFVWTADGRMRGWRADAPDPAALRALWDAVQRERFFELPARLGTTRAMHASYALMRVVGRRTFHEVRLVLGADDDPDEREILARAQRVWGAVPIPQGYVR